MNTATQMLRPRPATLSDLIDSKRHADRPAARLREIARLVHEDMGSLARQLFTIEDIEAAITNREIESLKTTGVFAQDEARTVRRQHVVKKSRPLNPDALARSKAESAAAVMMIDGRDLATWTIGQCKTAARTRGHESRVLDQIAQECFGLGDHKTVGDIYSREILARLVASKK